MKKLNVSMFLGLCVVMTPAVALAGNGGTGACLLQVPDTADAFFPDGKGFLGAVCVNGVTEFECLEIADGIEWFEDTTCGELEVPWTWEGGCQADVEPFGDQCYVLWFDGNGEEVCTDQGVGEWFEGDLTCGAAPVPAMPAAGMALMIMLIMGGALVLLTVRGSIPSA